MNNHNWVSTIKNQNDKNSLLMRNFGNRDNIPLQWLFRGENHLKSNQLQTLSLSPLRLRLQAADIYKYLGRVDAKAHRHLASLCERKGCLRRRLPSFLYFIKHACRQTVLLQHFFGLSFQSHEQDTHDYINIQELSKQNINKTQKHNQKNISMKLKAQSEK